MPRRTWTVLSLLVVLVACRDGPEQLAAPARDGPATQPQPAPSHDELTAALQLLDDPFVRELMRGVGTHTRSLDDAARDVVTSPTTEHVLALSRVVTLAKHRLSTAANDGEDNPDREILRAILELVLDDATVLLESAPALAVDEDPERKTQWDTTDDRSIER